MCFICFEETHLTFCIARLGEEEEESDDDEEEEYAPSESESEQSEVEPEEEQEEEEEEDIIQPTVEEKKVIMPPKKKKDLEDGFKSLSLTPDFSPGQVSLSYTMPYIVQNLLDDDGHIITHLSIQVASGMTENDIKVEVGGRTVTILYKTPNWFLKTDWLADVDPDPTRLNNLRVIGAGVDAEAPLRQRIQLPFEVMDQVLEEGMMVFQDGNVSHFVMLVYCVRLRSKESVFTREVLKQSRLIVSPRRRNAPAPGYAGQGHHQQQNHRAGNNNHAAPAPYPYGGGHLSDSNMLVDDDDL